MPDRRDRAEGGLEAAPQPHVKLGLVWRLLDVEDSAQPVFSEGLAGARQGAVEVGRDPLREIREGVLAKARRWPLRILNMVLQMRRGRG